MAPRRLPPELVGQILQFLDEEDLRVAAGVSREFYTQAWRAGLFIPHEFGWCSDLHCATGLAVLSEVVDHVVKKRLRLVLTLVFHECGPADVPRLGPAVSDVLRLIPIALPYLLGLHLFISGSLVHDISRALCHPAPHLQTLDLHIFTDLIAGHTVPVWCSDIFDEYAPKLRHVTLNGIRLPAGPVAAFARVVSLTLKGAPPTSDIEFVRHFPALRSLFLSDVSGVEAPTAAISYNIHGAQLEWLVVAEQISPTLMSVLLCGDSALSIPNVVCKCEEIQWTESLWRRTNDGPFSIRVAARSPLNKNEAHIYVVPAHQRWYRGYEIVECFADMEFPLLDLPGVTKRLTYLRLDNYYVTGFFTSTDVVFEALAEMQLDFQSMGPQSSTVLPPEWIDHFEDDDVSFDVSDGSPPPPWNKRSYYPACPSLEKLRLFAMYEKVTVSCREVAYLGRALSNCMGSRHKKAALELHGIQVRPLTLTHLVEESYSTVRLFQFIGWDSPLAPDSSLWDVTYRCPFP